VRPEGVASGRAPSLASVQAAMMAEIAGRGRGEVDALVVSDGVASAAERVAVYAFMYRARIAEALESQFPRLAKLLGAEGFAELAAAYIGEEPSRYPSLRYVGQRLPAWLAARRPLPSVVAGLAALEWARTDVFDVVDEPALTFDDVRRWPPEQFGELPLRLIAAHRVVTVPAGTAWLWDVVGSDGDGGGEGGGGEGSDAVESLVVWREGTAVYHRLISDGECGALKLAAAGTTFGVVCESLLGATGTEGEGGEEAAIGKAHAWMSTWLTDGLVRGLDSSR